MNKLVALPIAVVAAVPTTAPALPEIARPLTAPSLKVWSPAIEAIERYQKASKRFNRYSSKLTKARGCSRS
jgi:hypothetical protein